MKYVQADYTFRSPMDSRINIKRELYVCTGADQVRAVMQSLKGHVDYENVRVFERYPYRNIPEKPGVYQQQAKDLFKVDQVEIVTPAVRPWHYGIKDSAPTLAELNDLFK